MKFWFPGIANILFGKLCYNGKVLVQHLLIGENRNSLFCHKYQILNIKYFIEFLEALSNLS